MSPIVALRTRDIADLAKASGYPCIRCCCRLGRGQPTDRVLAAHVSLLAVRTFRLPRPVIRARTVRVRTSTSPTCAPSTRCWPRLPRRAPHPTGGGQLHQSWAHRSVAGRRAADRRLRRGRSA